MSQQIDNTPTIKTFRDFAAQTKRNLFYSEIPYPTSVMEGITHHKRTLYIPNNSQELSFLIGYADPKSFSDNALFFGTFFPLSLSKDKALKIRKKNILDSLNPFQKQKVFQTNSEIFNSETIISGNDEALSNMLFNDLSIQNIILNTFKMNKTFYIAINEFNLDFIPNFKEKSNFGIFSKQQWFTDSSIIENLFTNIEQLRLQIMKKTY